MSKARGHRPRLQSEFFQIAGAVYDRAGLEPRLVQVRERGEKRGGQQFQSGYGQSAGKDVIGRVVSSNVCRNDSKVSVANVEGERAGSADRFRVPPGFVFVVAGAGLATSDNFFSGDDEDMSEAFGRTVLDDACENQVQRLSNFWFHDAFTVPALRFENRFIRSVGGKTQFVDAHDRKPHPIIDNDAD